MDNPDKHERELALLRMATDITVAAIERGHVTAADVPGFISTVHGALDRVGIKQSAPVAPKPEPAVNPKRSVQGDFIVCLEDGKKFKSLKRHLMTHYKLTPDAYRAKWGLDPDYPMVAPNYAAQRSQLAKDMGLGRPRGSRVQ